MLQLIKHIFYMIQIVIGIIYRPTHKKQSGDLLQGDIYILKDELIGTIRIGSCISQNKIEDIKKHYYKGSRYKLQIVYRTHSTTHKQRREVLSELKQTYYNIYSKQYKVVMLI